MYLIYQVYNKDKILLIIRKC